MRALEGLMRAVVGQRIKSAPSSYFFHEPDRRTDAEIAHILFW